MADETSTNKIWDAVTLPRNALVKEAPERNYALLGMPKGSEYAGYRFLLDLDKVVKNDDGTVTVTLEGDIKLRRSCDEKRVTAGEVAAVLSNATADDFKEDTYPVTLPSAAVYGRYEKAYRFLMPYDSEYKGCFCSVLSSAVEEEDKEAGTVTLNLSDWMYVNVTMRGGGKVRIPAKEFADIMEKGKDSYTDRTHWVTVTVSKDAVLDKHQKQTRLRMPEGEYKGYAYYIPNGMLKNKKDGNIIIMLPETRNVYIKNADGDKIILTTKDFKETVDGKGAEAYTAVRKADAEQFIRKAREIKEKLPKELVETPNWVDVRIWKDKKGQREYVSSSMQRNLAIGRDEPEMHGASYEDVEAYGEKHKTDTVGFLFDGLGVVCLSVNGCMDDGKITSTAVQKIFDAAKGTYVEKSSDGKDMHVFGRMADIKTEHISKDGSMELFVSSDFLPVTGDAMTDARELKGFTEGSIIRGIIEANFEERKPIEPITEKDEKILEAAKKHPETGDIFTRLFSGENVKGTEEQSDESLMMRLSCRTRGDTDAMKRLYNASGRKNKDPEHIDHLAVRSKKNTADFLEETKAREMRERAETRRTDYSNSNYNAGYKY